MRAWMCSASEHMNPARLSALWPHCCARACIGSCATIWRTCRISHPPPNAPALGATTQTNTFQRQPPRACMWLTALPCCRRIMQGTLDLGSGNERVILKRVKPGAEVGGTAQICALDLPGFSLYTGTPSRSSTMLPKPALHATDVLHACHFQATFSLLCAVPVCVPLRCSPCGPSPPNPLRMLRT